MNVNTVELIGYYGGDTTHACSAWTSTNRNLTEEKIARIPSLLTMLATEGHHTPFEKSFLHFLVRSDIASHIHELKHRIGVSINAESARYKELKEDYSYIPQDWPEEWKEKLTKHSMQSNELYHQCLASLVNEYGFPKKRAKESSRYFKNYSSQIQCDISFNFRSFAHFQRLRNEEHAQDEIEEIAQKMLLLVKEIEGNPFKYTLEAFKL